MKHIFRHGILSLITAIAITPIFAEDKEVEGEGSQKEPIMLEEITIKGEALKEKNNPFSAHVMDLSDLNRVQIDNALRLIEQVPGMDLGAYRQGGTADVFSMRGFTGGGHGGDAAVYVDGIPLNESESHADGYADMNVLIPLELQRFTVYKGPVSPLFGNFARSGALTMTTRKGGLYQESRITGGAYGTLDAQFALGRSLTLGSTDKPINANLAFQLYRTDGYQTNSRYLKGTVSGRLTHAFSDQTDVTFSVRGHSGEWHAPGYMPATQFTNDQTRNQQAAFGEDDGGSKRFFAERFDINHSLGTSKKLLAFAYATQQQFTRFAKFGYTAGGQTERFYDRNVFGWGSSLNGQSVWSETPIQWVIGAEHFFENTQWKRWGTSNRVRQAQTEERDFYIHSISGFGQAEAEIHPLFRPTLGLRYDLFRGRYENNDPGQTAFERDMNNYSHFSPKFGLRSTLFDGVDARISVTNGFALPDGPAKYDPGLSVNPVRIWQYETGATMVPTSWLSIDVAGFILDTSGEIQEDPPGSGTFRNMGKTRRRGIESEWTIQPIASSLKLTSALSLLRTKVLENPDPAQVGTYVTGVPEHTVTLSAAYTIPSGFGGRIQWRKVGTYALTADNTQRYEGYNTTDLNLFYRLDNTQQNGWRIFIDVHNLFDQTYAEAVFYGFGTTNYAPAWPRNIAAGLSLSFE